MIEEFTRSRTGYGTKKRLRKRDRGRQRRGASRRVVYRGAEAEHLLLGYGVGALRAHRDSAAGLRRLRVHGREVLSRLGVLAEALHACVVDTRDP